MNFIEVYPNEYPHYQLVGDEDDMFIFTEALAEMLAKQLREKLLNIPKGGWFIGSKEDTN